MRLTSLIVACLWLAFILCWLILAQFNKRASPRAPWRTACGVRLIVIAIALIIVFSSQRRGGAPSLFFSVSRPLAIHPGPAGQWLGVALCMAGIGFAIWARLHLGRNWGMPMSLRQGHELVTSGPYTYVRHPIYSGILLAMLGSALARNLFWLVLLLVALAYFLYSAHTEEQMMLAQFPDAYPAYRRRTKMLIPFVV